MPDPIQYNAAEIDFTGRIAQSTTVAASPSGASETVIAQVAMPNNCPVISGVLVQAWAAYTVGTNGVSVNLKLRQTGTSGTTLAATGALNKTAAQLYADDVMGFDTAPVGAQLYVVTMTVASGSAASTVSAVQIVVTVL